MEKDNIKKSKYIILILVIITFYILIICIGQINKTGIIKRSKVKNTLEIENIPIDGIDGKQEEKNDIWEQIIKEITDKGEQSGGHIDEEDKKPEDPEDPEKPEEPEEPEVIEIFITSDLGKTIIKSDPLNIFKTKYYKQDAKIFPGLEGKYKFIIQNESNKKLLYTIQFEEINNSNINMKYKLKLGNNNIISEWTSVSDISIGQFEINELQELEYTLDWKWISTLNDIELGTNPDDIKYYFTIYVLSGE